jgi:hypothetical protein
VRDRFLRLRVPDFVMLTLGGRCSLYEDGGGVERRRMISSRSSFGSDPIEAAADAIVRGTVSSRMKRRHITRICSRTEIEESETEDINDKLHMISPCQESESLGAESSGTRSRARPQGQEAPTKSKDRETSTTAQDLTRQSRQSHPAASCNSSDVM